MKPLPQSKARDVFSHLLAFGTLFFSVVNAIVLSFQYVDVKFPDSLQFYYVGALDTIRQAMASLIVVWPAFILLSWAINKNAKAHPEKREISIRKWLLYLTLFVTAIAIMADLVTLVNFFLNGEMSARFILKVGVVLVVAAAVFGYYLWDLRSESISKSRVPKYAAAAASFVLLASIILGFVFVGSPARQRAVRFDDQRVNDLSMIQNQITVFYTNKRVLPAAVKDLNDSLSGFAVPADPVTGQGYEYIIKSPLSFDLCATFAAESVGKGTSSPYSAPIAAYRDFGPFGQNWMHKAGRACFERTIDPANFPPFPALIK